MAKQAKPNVLFIMADDIGWFIANCHNNGFTKCSPQSPPPVRS
jgi:arylsulfatase A-like enzyme